MSYKYLKTQYTSAYYIRKRSDNYWIADEFLRCTPSKETFQNFYQTFLFFLSPTIEPEPESRRKPRSSSKNENYKSFLIMSVMIWTLVWIQLLEIYSNIEYKTINIARDDLEGLLKRRT